LLAVRLRVAAQGKCRYGSGSVAAVAWGAKGIPAHATGSYTGTGLRVSTRALKHKQRRPICTAYIRADKASADVLAIHVAMAPDAELEVADQPDAKRQQTEKPSSDVFAQYEVLKEQKHLYDAACNCCKKICNARGRLD
jgi:hypothetical protein